MLKIIVFTLISAVIIVYLRSVNQELALLATVCTGIILLVTSLNYLSQTFVAIKKLVELTNLNGELYKNIIKITAIGYLFEFSAGVLEDFGLKSISDKLVFVGKIIILSLSLPIIYSLLNVITELI